MMRWVLFACVLLCEASDERNTAQNAYEAQQRNHISHVSSLQRAEFVVSPYGIHNTISANIMHYITILVAERYPNRNRRTELATRRTGLRRARSPY